MGALLSTQSLLMLSLGVSLYLAVLHSGIGGIDVRAHRWLAGWSFAATFFLLWRMVQLETPDPEDAILAARLTAAASPILIWTLVRFVMELAGRATTRAGRSAFAAFNFGLAALSALTPWVVTDRLDPRSDLFGVPYHGVVGGPGMLAIGAYTAAALAWAWRVLGVPSRLEPSERRSLALCLTIYGAMGLTSVLSALRWIPLPGIAEFGPVVVSIGASHLIASRQRRLARDLHVLADQQTSALQESEERYRGLIENAPVAVMSCDRAGNVQTANPRLFEMVGASYRSLQRPLNLLDDAHVQAGGIGQLVQRALTSGQAVRAEGRYVSRHGTALDGNAIVTPSRDAGGEITGALVLLEDVTERRAVEARLRQSQKLEAVGQLAASIADAIDEPMASARAKLARVRAECQELHQELAASGSDAPSAVLAAETEQLIDESLEGVERTIAVIRDMRDLSSGGPLGREPVDLNALLESVVRIAATQRRGGVRLVERYDPLPKVQGNAGQLRQVFLNLLVNAIQAVREGGRVEIATASHGERVCASVRDDGPGIAPEHRERLFEPFFTTKPAGEGTGLGLYISYQIVQSHGGEIRVSGAPGEGASFDVWLPAADGTGPEGTVWWR